MAVVGLLVLEVRHGQADLVDLLEHLVGEVAHVAVGRVVVVGVDEQVVDLADQGRIAARVVGADGTHLMLHVRRGVKTFKAMAFGQGHRAGELALGRPLHLAYTPRWNTFRGTTQLELVVEDFQVEQLDVLQ